MYSVICNHKLFRSVTVMLLALSLLLAGCGAGKKSAMSEDFQKVFGAELGETIEPTAEAMVQELTEAYEVYMEDGDLMALTLSVNGTLESYDSFLKQLRDDISAKMEEATDPEQKAAASVLSLQGVMFLNVSLSMAVFDYEMFGFYTGDETELEQANFDTINGISQWFYGTDIVPAA